MKRFLKMFSLSLCLTLMVLVSILSINALANTFVVATDRTSYTGTLTKYGSLNDAQNQTNVIGAYGIPNRDTVTPYNTPYRDLGIYTVNNVSSFDPINTFQFLTAWWYTTNLTQPADSGYGNPNNTNTGFLQLYDANCSTVTSANAYFHDQVGSYLTKLTLNVTGENATYANDYARLWPAPLVGGAANVSRGTFLSYELDITFSGLQGQWNPSLGLYEATNHPDDVTGTFSAIFQNTNTADPDLNAFYVVSLNFGMDNWAFGMAEDGTLNGSFTQSEFAAPTPLPGTLLLLGSGLTGLVIWRRRKVGAKS